MREEGTHTYRGAGRRCGWNRRRRRRRWFLSLFSSLCPSLFSFLPLPPRSERWYASRNTVRAGQLYFHASPRPAGQRVPAEAAAAAEFELGLSSSMREQTKLATDWLWRTWPAWPQHGSAVASGTHTHERTDGRSDGWTKEEEETRRRKKEEEEKKNILHAEESYIQSPERHRIVLWLRTVKARKKWREKSSSSSDMFRYLYAITN